MGSAFTVLSQYPLQSKRKQSERMKKCERQFSLLMLCMNREKKQRQTT
jgi:hypothetical protein